MKNIAFIFVLFFISCIRQEAVTVSNGEIQESEVVFGIDISEYQGEVCWETLSTQEKHPIEFVIMRATVGVDRIDNEFKKNWRHARKKRYIVGAYHYYRPNEYSIDQVSNYLKVIKKRLDPGDFIPILDIENISNIQNMDRLRLGVKRWLDAVEKEYGVKPIIYTSQSFWEDNLAKDFSDYPLWVASYSLNRREDSLVKNAEIHQFTDKVIVPGINGNTVDGNDIKRKVLESILLPKQTQQ